MVAADDQPGALRGSLIRKRRKQLHLTLQQLGERSGVSFSYLSQLERDNATPTLGTLAQIAQALGVGVDYFINAPRPADAVTRQDERMRFAINGSSVEYERLGAEFPGNEMSSFILHVPPGFQTETVSHEGEEIIYILEGTITQMVGAQTFVLGAGDSLHYRGTTPHSYANPGDQPARILWSGNLKMFHSPGAAAFSPPAPERTEKTG